jgi:hypothetical protein
MRSTQYQLETWELSQHLLEEKGKRRKYVSRCPVAETFGYTDFQCFRASLPFFMASVPAAVPSGSPSTLSGPLLDSPMGTIHWPVPYC